MRIVKGAIRGAVVGAGIAILMISLDQLGPFSVPVNSFIDRAIFKVCPFYVLGFSKDVTSKAAWFSITIAGNALVYGALFALVVLGDTLLRKFTVYKAS